MPTGSDFVWGSLQTATNHLLDHLHHHLDRQMGPPMAPPPWQGSGGVALAPPAPALAPAPWTAAAVGAAGAGVAAAAPPTGPAADATAPTWSYAEDVAVGATCLNCLRKHLGTATQALAAARDAAQQGTPDVARRYLARASAELAVLEQYDLAPDLLARTPPADRAVVEAVRPCLDRLRSALPTPEAAAVVWGSVDEAIRFARSPRRTPRDAAEVMRRLQVVDTQGAFLERVAFDPATVRTWPPGQQDQAWAARAALREGSHRLDQGDPLDPATLEAAAVAYEAAAVGLTPLPDAATLAQWADAAHRCQAMFYAAYLQRLQTARKTPTPPA